MKIHAFLIILVFNTSALLAQNTIALPLIKNFNKSDYKGGSQTWSIDQGDDDRIYFGNNEGLIVFDGFYWKTYPLPNKTIVRSVKYMNDGKIFVGGQGDAGYFSPGPFGDLAFHSILKVVPERSRDFADIWNIEEHNQAVFFRASDQILLFQNGQVEIFPAPNEWVYMEKVGDLLLAQDKQKGLFFWTGQTWQLVQNGDIQGADVFHGGILLNADSVVLVTYLNKNFLFSKNTLTPYKQITNSFISEITGIKPLSNAEYAVGTTGEGCVIINKRGEWVQHISKAEGLQDNSILSIFKDKQGNIWTGLNSGISMIAYGAPIKFIKPNKLNDLSGYAASIFDNSLYVATNDGAYRTKLDEKQSDYGFSKSFFEQVPNSFGLAYRFEEINQQLLMAHNEGTFLIGKSRAEKLSSDPSWVFLPIDKVFPTKRVLIGNYSGLKWLQFANGTFFSSQNITGLRESFRFLVQDNEGGIWASHPYRGIFNINFLKDSLQYRTELFTEANGLPSTYDNHVFRVKNRVVFATSKGIFEFNNSKTSFEPSSFFAPIFGDMPIRYLKEDSNGNLWFISEKKIGYVAYKNGIISDAKITYFPEITGQILSGFEYIYPYNEENVLVSAEKGLIQINLKNYLSKVDKPKISISSIHAIGSTDSIIFNGFRTKSTSQKPEDIVLPYQYNSLHIEYSVPSYGFQENIEYSYYLEGFDKEWSKWTAKAEKDYTKLPNGDYVFKVKARSNLGNETEVESYTFSIAPPWYKSILARVIYLMLFFFGVYLLFNYHRKKLARQRKQFEEKQEQLRVVHQLEIEKNEKEIIRLQNFKLANEISFKNRELADTTMHLVERSDALNKVKETLQRLYKYDSSNADLKKALHLMNDIEHNDTDWDKFASSFDEINNDFLRKLKVMFPGLTHSDQKLCAYLQLNLSSKEIAQLLNISIRGVEISRYRLRKKLGIPTEKAIGDYLNEVVNEGGVSSG